MLPDILRAIVRSVAAFTLLITAIRAMGRKAISEMTSFDFGIALALGSVTANIGFGSEHSFHTAVTVLVTFACLGLLVGKLHIRFFSFDKLINSEPLVLIEDGRLIRANMKKTRITLTELTALLREKNVFNIGDVLYAILECDGKLSVLPRTGKAPLTPSDMHLHPAEKGLTKDLVMDGRILAENLAAAGLTEEWLLDQLKTRGIRRVKDVFYAAMEPSGRLYVSTGGGRKELPGQHEIE